MAPKNMKKPARSVSPFQWGCIVFLAFLAGLTGPWSFRYNSGPSAKATSSPSSAVVKVIVGGSGHGSGVHIGGGYVVTAAHVIGDGTPVVRVKSMGGGEIVAEILWRNDAADIALLRSALPDDRRADLACRMPVVGEEVLAEGNPANLEFLTSWLKVSGRVEERGRWRSAMVVNGTILQGMSGGPLFDREGRVLGIVVGTLAMGSSPFAMAPTGFGFAVPATEICRLLARPMFSGVGA